MFARIKKYVFTILLLPPLFFAIYSSARFVEVINQNQFNNEVLKNNGPTVVEFSASWCGVCQAVKQPFEQIAIDPEFNGVTFARVDVDQHPDLSKKNNIMGVPTFLYLENGNKVNQEVGVTSMNNFDNSLRTNIRTHFKLAQADVPGAIVDETTVMMPADSTTPMQTEQIQIEDMTAQAPMPATTDMVPTEEMPTMPVDNTGLIAPETSPAADTTMIQPTQDDQMVVIMQEEPAETGGLLNGIKEFFMAIVNGVIGFLKAIIDAIKGLFGR